MRRVSLCLFLCATITVVSGACASTPEPAPTTEMGPIAQRLAQLEQPKAALDVFSGTFDALGVVVSDGSEQFTARFEGGRIVMSSGVAADADPVLTLSKDQLAGLEEALADGAVSDEEKTGIVAALMGPLNQMFLEHPIPSSALLRKAVDLEDRIHVNLVDTAGGVVASQTLAYADGAWRVSDGLDGTAQRTFTLTADDAIEYQRQAHTARTLKSPAGWAAFAAWYKSWRDGVSTLPDAVSRAG